MLVLLAVLALCNAFPTGENQFKSEPNENVLFKYLTTYGFSWSNCGDQSIDPIVVSTMDVAPDPIVIPGTVTLSLDAVVKTLIAEPTSLEIVVKKNFFGDFIEVPCVDNLGSCTYTNPCSLLQNVTCPPQVLALGWNCRCPLTPNEIKIDKGVVNLPKLNLPSFIENGEYQVQATLMNGKERVLCYAIQCSLQST